MAQIPAAVGLFVCEQVIIEESTRNVTPVNCFTHRKVREFPSEPLSFVVFAVLNDGNGDIQLNLTIGRLDSLDNVLERSASLRLLNPLQEARCIFRINDCSFPVAGAYEVTLRANNEIIALRRIRVN
jgi:hypothetical protein